MSENPIPPKPPEIPATPFPHVPPTIQPPPPLQSPGGIESWRKLLVILLSVYFGLASVSILCAALDASLVLFFGIYWLTIIDGFLLFLTLLGTVFVYGLMALSPMVPKRIFLPVVLLILLPVIVALPAAIFCYSKMPQIDVAVSWLQVLGCFVILRWMQESWMPRWPLVAERTLGKRLFSWPNTVLFIALNLFLFLPATVFYVGGCASMALSHFTNGFVSLRPGGIVLQARKYVRDDGRTIVLFPMSHIAESSFYRSVADSVPSNSVVLLEGVTDENHLLTNHISYKRAAKSLHLAEQHEDFKIPQGHLVPADVDVKEFTSNTIAVLNMVTLVHSEGINPHTISMITQFSLTPASEQELFEDLLLKRNDHVLKELFSRLPNADNFIIPWGAAHMAGLSQAIEKAGFHLAGTRDFVSIRFGQDKSTGKGGETPWVLESDKAK